MLHKDNHFLMQSNLLIVSGRIQIIEFKLSLYSLYLVWIICNFALRIELIKIIVIITIDIIIIY